MMTWGFPCTDISVAGNQKGFIDKDGNKTRSGMYYEGIRILREKKPALSIIENVKNLTSKKFKKEFEMVLSDLDEAGYNTYYKVLNAKDYGVPQNRERVFIVSVRKELDNGKFKFPEPFDNGIRLKDILEDEVDDKYYLPDEKVKRFITDLNTESSLLNVVNQVGNIVDTGNWNNPQRGRIYHPDGCSPALNCCGGGGREPKIMQVGKINSSQDGIVVDPDGITKAHAAEHGNQPKIICGIDKSINNSKKIEYANCITSREDRGISNRVSEGTAVVEMPGISYCLDASYYKGTTPEQYLKKKRRQLVIETVDEIRIRKLIPLECFRLMGFSDEDFFRAMIGQAKNAEDFIRQHPYLIGKTIMNEAETIQGISNSQLYKQSGNSIVVDVLYYLLIELYKAMPYLFDDLKLSSFFSGIGAFEVALDRLYKGINIGNFTHPQAE